MYPVRDTYDVLQDLLADAGIEPPLSEDLAALFFDEVWVSQHDPGEAPDATLRDAWDRFTSYVKHESRFLLLERHEDEDDRWTYTPRNLLRELADTLLALNLIRVLEAGTPVYRARAGEAPDFKVPQAFSPPQRRKLPRDE